MRIVFTGGGTGGHIFPIIAVAREIRRLVPDVELQYLGPRGAGDEAFAAEGIVTKFILSGKIPRYATPSIILELIKIPLGILFALWRLYWIMPDVIFAKGGYGSLPVVLAGKFYMIPELLHESDSVPGFANRLAAPFAKKILTAFVPSPAWSGKAIQVGNPARTALSGITKEEGARNLQLKGGRPTVFILGGSQGAEQINDLILAVLKDLLAITEVIHQCGAANFDEVVRGSRLEASSEFLTYYHPAAFLEERELASAYATADIVVARAGSGSIFEIALMGKPSILIPLLSSAQNHQRENARLYAEAGACVVLDPENLTPHLFLAELKKLLASPQELSRLAQNAKAFARPDAATLIAHELLRV